MTQNSTICVIGGGLSGLFFTYKLLQKNRGYKVHVFEKGDRLGGRIHTVYTKDGFTYETGAGRFNSTHTEVFRLIRDLGLMDKVKNIDMNKRVFLKDGNIKDAGYNRFINDILFKKILKHASKYDDKYLKSVTLGQFMNKIIGAEQTQDVVNAFGYNSEFEIHNAYTALKIFEHDFNDNIEYFYLQGGLSQIIVILHQRLLDLGAHIHVNSTVNHYDPIKNIIEYVTPTQKKTQTLKCNKVVFSVTHDCLGQFEDLIEYDNDIATFLRGTQSAPLHRIFAQFPIDKKTGYAWFHDLPRTTTNQPIRYIIPHNSQTGFIQISYTDNLYAKYWHNMTKEKREKELMKYLKVVFPHHKIPSPIWIHNYYWKEGVTYWKPNSMQYKNISTKNYYICGEMMSPFHCGWMEGSLRTTKNVLKFFE
jgi:protoporphyrinogen oxidase